MPPGLQHTNICKPVVDVAQIVADNDIHAIEDLVDGLLACNMALVDPYSLCTHDYLAVLQPLQLALEYTWALYSRHEVVQGTAATCLNAATAFRSALHSYAKAAEAEVQLRQNCSLSRPATQGNLASSRQSERLRRQLRPLKKAHAAARAALKAEELHNQQTQIVLRSRRADVDWAALRNIQVPNLGDVEGMQNLCKVLHILAYADMRQQPWQDLRASDCLHFIQLAQCGLEYLLHQATTAHSVLEASREQVRRQEAGISRLHQRSRECFRQLKAPHFAQQTDCLALQDGGMHTQPEASVLGDHSAPVQAVQTEQELQREQQLDVAALGPQSRQQRSASPVKGSQVRYMASSVTPVLVQGHAADTACTEQATAGRPSTDAEQGALAQLSNQDTQGGPSQASLLQEPGCVTQHLDTSLRHEAQHLHEARIRVAELWAAVAALGQEAAASSSPSEAAAAVASASPLDWRADMAVLPQQPINHTTSLNVDLEAMKAAERRHAEAQLRSVFADIKQKAFADITQRINQSAEVRRNSHPLGTASSHDLSASQSVGGNTPKHASHTNSKQLMQRFSSQAPISQLVRHLQGGSGLQRLSSSQPHSSTARPPKGRSFGMQPLRRSDVGSPRIQSTAGKYNVQKTPFSMSQAEASPNQLMRLTSCVKLNKVPL